jgi:hypothetical protein
MVMLAMTILVFFWMVYWATAALHCKVQPAALHCSCSLATWRILGQQLGLDRVSGAFYVP